MNLGGNTVLITGGASGIGLAFAQRFVAQGSEVIVCGRRADVLERAKADNPALHTRVCDVASAKEREELAQWATREFPSLNVLINNAGIQRRISLLENEAWEETGREIAINLEAPIHLSRLFVPHLREQPNPVIANVSSGLSFAPSAHVPVYCATKAALHSFTLSLRHQLRYTPIEVIEIIPPAVQTDLGGVGLHTFGEPLDAFADGIFAGLRAGDAEVAYGSAVQRSRAAHDALNPYFAAMNARE